MSGLQKLSEKERRMTFGQAAKIVIPSIAMGAGLTMGASKSLDLLSRKFNKPWLHSGLRHSLLLGALADVPPAAYAVYQASRPPKPKKLGANLIKVREA